MRVIVIGGLGNFGARICQRLAQEPGLTVIAASRSTGGGVHTFSSGRTVATLPLDINSPDFEARLAEAAPGLVIHCAGPFQGQDYGVAKAACAVGAHYLDLADGRDFVEHFSANVDAQAKAAGVLVMPGWPLRAGMTAHGVNNSVGRTSGASASSACPHAWERRVMCRTSPCFLPDTRVSATSSSMPRCNCGFSISASGWQPPCVGLACHCRSIDGRLGWMHCPRGCLILWAVTWAP